MEKLFAVKTGNRFILWCDEHWYETTGEPAFIFTKEEATHIAQDLLPNHYKYTSIIIDKEGNEEVVNFFKPKKKGNFSVSFGGMSISLGSIAI